MNNSKKNWNTQKKHWHQVFIIAARLILMRRFNYASGFHLNKGKNRHLFLVFNAKLKIEKVSKWNVHANWKSTINWKTIINWCSYFFAQRVVWVYWVDKTRIARTKRRYFLYWSFGKLQFEKNQFEFCATIEVKYAYRKLQHVLKPIWCCSPLHGNLWPQKRLDRMTINAV